MKNLCAATLLALTSMPAFAQMLATGDQVTAAIGGNTVQGSMLAGGAYTEFYQADGIIKGADYTGTWTIKDNQMCFDYGSGADCWSVRIEGAAVTWVKDGADGGTGTIVTGNPNNF
jgi:hypothetical protein